MPEPFNFLLWEQARREHPSDRARRQARYRELMGEPAPSAPLVLSGLPVYRYVEPEETTK